MSVTTWSLPETDARTVESVLEELIERSQALTAHLVDRSGHLLVTAGVSQEYDLTEFASLASADLAANDELAKIIGEPHVDGVACIGSRRSLASTRVGEDLVLCVVFDGGSTLGLVRHRMKKASDRLWPLFAHLSQGVPSEAPEVAPAREKSEGKAKRPPVRVVEESAAQADGDPAETGDDGTPLHFGVDAANALDDLLNEEPL